jgi:hypothetical protein
VLAVDLFEALGGLLEVALFVEEVKPLIVELVGRVIRDDLFLAEEAARRHRDDDERKRAQPQRQPPLPRHARHDQLLQHHSDGIPHRTQRHPQTPHSV